ncbi:MAG: alpha/beta hydrolase [Mariniphaga sp.]
MEQIIEINNYKIFVKVEGEGPSLILLHSYWGNQWLFDNLAKEFSKNHKVIRIDLPGHGNSGNPPDGYRFDDFARVLDTLLIQLGISQKSVVIGHSMGGYVALAYAACFPEKIESLVLMHAPVKEADIQSIKLRNREASLLQKGKKDLLLQVTIPSNFAPEDQPQKGEWIELLNQSANQVTADGAIRSIEAMNHRKNYLEVLQISDYRILIIVGKYDKVYAAVGQIEDGGKIAHAEVLLLNHSGHLGFLEEEELVTNRLIEFLN